MATAVPAYSVRPAPAARTRLDSIDLLRGIVMVIMVLDHTRDFVHGPALRYDPTDLASTSFAIFMTRWITHFCAPVFVFLAGVSAYLQKMRGKSIPDLSRFLLTRGIWLIAVEIVVLHALIWFNLDFSFVGSLRTPPPSSRTSLREGRSTICLRSRPPFSTCPGAQVFTSGRSMSAGRASSRLNIRCAAGLRA